MKCTRGLIHSEAMGGMREPLSLPYDGIERID
jgi:hypothetical protein